MHGKFDPLDRGPSEVMQWLQRRWAERAVKSEDQLHQLFQSTQVGPADERVVAILRWAEGAAKNPQFKMTSDGPQTSLDAFDYLRCIVEADNETSLKDAALRAMGCLFRGSYEEEVSQYLARLIVAAETNRAIKLCAYRVLSHIAQDHSTRALKIEDTKRTVERKHSVDLDDVRKLVETVRHFVFETQDPEFSVEHDIRWDWVKSFL